MPMASIYMIGDIHGQYAKLLRLLKHAGLVNEDARWCGGDSVLCFMGDLLDRGMDGMAVLDQVMALQTAAEEDGGAVHMLLGNHEVMILAAYRFAVLRLEHPISSFLYDWVLNGGQTDDLMALTEHHVRWLAERPALFKLGDHLMMHADSQFYAHFGETIDEVNANVHALLMSEDVELWDGFLSMFTDRLAFFDGEIGEAVAIDFLRQFGGRQIIHGHTPIPLVTDFAPEETTQPLEYANGRCVNLDGGMYMGGPGFIYQLPDTVLPEIPAKESTKQPTV